MTNNVFPVASIVIPAHDEAAVIARCLNSLLPAVRTGELEVVVVSNGSRDATVAVAESLLAGLPSARVEAIDAASKVAALRRGDEIATVYPRIYLDADIELSIDTVRSLAGELAAVPGPAVGAPGALVDTSQCSSPVSAYYRIWRFLPYVAGGTIGSGVYAVNAAGGAHLGVFPDVVNDDGWVRRRFESSQRIRSDGGFVIHAPRTVRALISRRARIAVGNQALNGADGVVAGGAADAADAQAGIRQILGAARPSVTGLYDLTCFLGITVVARGLGTWRRARGRERDWSTDHTSRVPSEQAAA